MQAAAAARDVTLAWPPNLDVLDRLLTCFDRPYREAYGDCRPETPAP
jgi:hypothetical protein